MEQSAIANQKLQGGCFCGRVQYRVQLPVKWCAHCHCEICRKTQSAPFVTWFGVEKINFEVLRGEADIAWFDSSQNAQRGHCIHCGTPLFFVGKNWPDEVHITRESANADIKQVPQIHVFYDRHVSYFQVDDQLDKFGGHNGFVPLAINPKTAKESNE
ncbi:GFA family protein [Aliikangiella maris]|uniref:GFA family protein n=2 Tax=Aliikangiella maris TaxID=3162458 RepID=A0ABV2BX45_9GAMM